MTSRELADAIDQLIRLRIEARLEIQMSINWPAEEAGRRVNQLEEQSEVQIREIADALKRLDHNNGVYAG